VAMAVAVGRTVFGTERRAKPLRADGDITHPRYAGTDRPADRAGARNPQATLKGDSPPTRCPHPATLKQPSRGTVPQHCWGTVPFAATVAHAPAQLGSDAM
jgi:hypothetical protein